MNNSIMKTCVLVGLIFCVGWSGSATAAYLGGITFDKDSPCFLPHGHQINISIDYKVDHPDGALIYARPYTLGSPTYGYNASGSQILPMGTGTTTQNFIINTGESVVTHIRVFMVSVDQTETFLEIFVPVHYVYGSHGIFNIQADHGEYSRLPHDKPLNIDFDYEIDWTGNVKIFARPFTDGSLSPGYSASGSADLPPSGSYSQYFHFGQDADVTDIRFQVYNEDQSELLYEVFVPYDIHWREAGIYDITFNWTNGESLHNSHDLVATFTLEHSDQEDRYAWAWCTTDGSYTPGGVYQGSVPLPAGPQTITRYCRVNSGEQFVNGVRFTYGLPDEVFFDFEVPVDFHYGPHAIQNHEFIPASPAILSNDEPLNMTYDYLTDLGEGVRIFCRPAYDGELLFGISSAGSPLHPAPTGSGNFWLTFSDGDHLASSMRFHMTNPDQSVQLLEHFTHGWWAWGASSTITPAAEGVPAIPAVLEAAYPNPFNPVTNIPVLLNTATHVQLSVYDIRGRLVDQLQEGHLEAGRHLFTFTGDKQASGVYFYRLKTPHGVQSRSMMLIK